MFNIEKYLQKFSKNVADIELYKKQISESIEKHTQINISTSDVEIKNYIVYVNSSPAVKNKLFIYKEKILEDITNSVSIKIVDIK